jgi:pimeloyl-ACP methyl ester carboxylesterase
LSGYHSSRVESRVYPGPVYVMEAGPTDARTVILIHGIARDGAHDWDDLIPVLARTRRVLSLDLPGFGRSSKLPASYDPVSYANLIDELIGTMVRGDFDLVAHSMGVSVALEVAQRHPDRVTHLVVADAAALLHGQALALAQIERGQERLGIFGKLLDPVRHTAYDMMGRMSDQFMHGLARGIPGAAASQAAAELMAHDSGEALDGIVAPTLVIWGGRDEVVSERGAWVLVSRIRNARIAFIEEAGHLPMRETPLAFNELVTRWLAGDEEVGKALAPAVVASSRDGKCLRQRGRYAFSGAYRKISIEGCRDVVLHGVRAQEIEIYSSSVTAEDTVVTGDQVAIVMWRSRLKLSGGALSASVPLRLKGSEVDLAGVTFTAGLAAVEAIGDAKILCSLCRFEGLGAGERMHGFQVLRAAETLGPAGPQLEASPRR